MENKKNNVKNIVIIILISLLIILLLYFVYDKVLKKSNENHNEVETNENSETEEKKDIIDNRKYLAFVCESKSGPVKVEYDKANCDNLIGEIKTETENAESLSIYLFYKKPGGIGGATVLFNDNGLKIYNTKDNNVEKINLENSFDGYALVGVDHYSEKIIGIIFSDNNKHTYYNIKLDKKMYSNHFGEGNVFYYVESLADGDYLLGYDFEFVSDGMCSHQLLYNANKEEIVFPRDDSSICDVSYKVFKHNDKYYYIKNIDRSNTIIYNNNKQKITENVKYTVGSNGILYTNKENDNKILQYDIEGNLIKTLEEKDYNVIYMLSNDYALVLSNNKELLLVNLVKNETKKITDWKTENKIENAVSGYRKESLINIKDFEGNYREEGFYVVVSNNNQYTEYFYNPATKDVKTKLIGNSNNGICGLHYEFSYCS